MQEVVDLLAGEYGWSDSVSNRPDKLQRESLRSTEAVQLAEVLGYEIVWKKRGDRLWQNRSMRPFVSPSTKARAFYLIFADLS